MLPIKSFSIQYFPIEFFDIYAYKTQQFNHMF